MAVSVTLPKMGESVVEGTIIRWLKQEGEWVNEDEPIVEISTDKIDAEMPSPAAGVLQKILAQPDETVQVGAEIAVIDETASKDGASGGSATPAAAAPSTAAPEEAKAPPAEEQEQAAATPAYAREPEAASPPREEPEAPSPAPEKPAAAAPAPAPQGGDADGDGQSLVTSPLVRKLARERGVDLAGVRGTGSGGRVTKEDVLAAAETGNGSGKQAAPRAPAAQAQPASPTRAPAAAPAAAVPTPAPRGTSVYQVPSGASEDVPFGRVRRAIAEHMTRSLRTGAQLTSVVEIDMTRVAQLRSRAKGEFERSEGIKLTFLPFIASAIVQALRAFPEFNAHVLEDGQTARIFRQVDLGIAVGRDEGLIVPVIHGADGMNIVGLARAIADVAERARTKGGLKPDDVTGGTITLTNYGSSGALIDTPIISQPQVAIIGTGAIQKRPAVISVDGADAIAVRHSMFLATTYDHRWIDGHKAGEFGSRVRHILETADFAHELGLDG